MVFRLDRAFLVALLFAVTRAVYNVLHIVSGTCSSELHLSLVSDDLRPELGCYGLPDRHTPNLDKLAAGGTVFDRAYAQIGVCGPSRNSFMSGRRPDKSRTWNFINSFREDHPTDWTSLPGVFLKNGMLSLGAGKLYHPKMPAAYDGNLSWSEFHSNLPFENPCWNTANNLNSKACKSHTPASAECDGGLPCIFCPIDIAAKADPKNIHVTVENEWCSIDALEDSSSVAKAITLMRQAKAANKNFYLGVGMHKPHMPWQFSPEDLSKHPAEAIDLPSHRLPPTGVPGIALTFSDGNADKGNHTSPWVPLSDSSARAARRAYRAAVTGMDRKLGVCSFVRLPDHGWHLGEHGEWRKMTNFEAVARVPLMIRAPWLHHNGTRSSALVELVDLLPTLAELAGVALPAEQFDGVSMVPLLMPGKHTQKEYVFSQYPRKVKFASEPWKSNDPIHDDRETFTHMGYTVRSDGFRYTEWVGWNQSSLLPIWSEVAGVELYDHRGIPGYPTDFNAGENENVVNSTEFADTVKLLASVLRQNFP